MSGQPEQERSRIQQKDQMHLGYTSGMTSQEMEATGKFWCTTQIDSRL